MGVITENLREEIAKRMEKNYSEGVNEANINIIDRLIKSVAISEIESSDEVFKKFLDDVEHYKEKIMNGLFGGEDYIGEQIEINKSINEIMRYFYEKYDNLENIILKGYEAGLYFSIRMEEESFTKKKNKILSAALRRGETQLLFSIVTICDNHSGEEEFKDITKDIIVMIYNMSVDKKYNYGEKITLIIERLYEYMEKTREEKGKYIYIEDLLISFYGTITTEYFKRKFMRPEYNKYVQNIEKIYSMSRFYDVVKVLEIKEEECPECRRILEEGKELPPLIKNIIIDKKFRKSNLKFFKTEKKRVLKEAEEHFVKEHGYVNAKKLENLYNIIATIMGIIVMGGVLFYSIIHHYSKGQIKLIGFALIIPLLFILHKVYWSITNKIYKGKEVF